ncbi:hypothetical protein M0802_008384 [Mischocyttarus mexicanus]|nr:hypothetical protein M0802_008384 [Mischocyttarus mexicanus]
MFYRYFQRYMANAFSDGPPPAGGMRTLLRGRKTEFPLPSWVGKREKKLYWKEKKKKEEQKIKQEQRIEKKERE